MINKFINFNFNNKSIKIKKTRNYISDILIFGSYARQDYDKLSDIDILVICKNPSDINLKKSIAKSLNIPISWISLYSKKQIYLMLEKGSLFLWHIKYEHILLFSSRNWLIKRLNFLKKYTYFKNDLEEYLKIIDDIENSINSSICNTFDYEVNLLATILRNTSILHCHKCGFNIFNRNKSFKKSQELLKKQFISLSEYDIIYNYRLKIVRNNIEHLKKLNLLEYVNLTKEYIEEVISYGK